MLIPITYGSHEVGQPYITYYLGINMILHTSSIMFIDF